MSLSEQFNFTAPPPQFSAYTDKRGRQIKTEEDFQVGERMLGDGSKGRVRNGKVLSRVWVDGDPVEKKTQADKKAALQSSEERRAQRNKAHLDVRARNYQL